MKEDKEWLEQVQKDFEDLYIKDWNNTELFYGNEKHPDTNLWYFYKARAEKDRHQIICLRELLKSKSEKLKEYSDFDYIGHCKEQGEQITSLKSQLKKQWEDNQVNVDYIRRCHDETVGNWMKENNELKSQLSERGKEIVAQKTITVMNLKKAEACVKKTQEQIKQKEEENRILRILVSEAYALTYSNLLSCKRAERWLKEAKNIVGQFVA